MKFRILRKIVKKIKNTIAAKGNTAIIIDPIQTFIENGNMLVGKNTLIEYFSFHSNELKKNILNVEIGDDCHIMGQIELHSSSAQVKIGNRVSIGPNTKIFCREYINIDDDVMISWDCTLMDTNAHSLKSIERKDDVVDWKKGFQHKNWDVAETKSINIKSKSWIGFGSIILKGVTIGTGCIVGCGSVVTKSTKDYSIVGGNPAAYIKDTV